MVNRSGMYLHHLHLSSSCQLQTTTTICQDPRLFHRPTESRWASAGVLTYLGADLDESTRPGPIQFCDPTCRCSGDTVFGATGIRFKREHVSAAFIFTCTHTFYVILPFSTLYYFLVCTAYPIICSYYI